MKVQLCRCSLPVEIPINTIGEEIRYLMAAYYVFGVEHPSQYKPFLYFFQDMVMDKAAADNSERPTIYASLVATITVKWNSTRTCLHFISIAIALVCLYKHVVSHILLMVILKYMYACTFSLFFSHLYYNYSQHSSRTLLRHVAIYNVTSLDNS